MVPSRRPNETDHLLAVPKLRTGRRQPVLRTIEVQQRQSTRRTTERVHPGHRLLAPIATLAEVDGGVDPPRLVGDRPVVRVDPVTRFPARAAPRPSGPHPFPTRRTSRRARGCPHGWITLADPLYKK